MAHEEEQQDKEKVERAERLLSRHSEDYRRYQAQREEEKTAREYERQGRIIAEALRSNFDSILLSNQELGWQFYARSTSCRSSPSCSVGCTSRIMGR